MSLHAHAVPDIPEDTAQIAKAVFRKGNSYMTMRDELGTFFTDDQFVDLYPADGQPAFSPWRLALICVMQFAENLTDRQTAEAVRARIDWKYALSLKLDDTGFDHSILCEFRQRLLVSGKSEQVLNQMLSHFKSLKLLKARGKQRTDSTHVLAAIRLLNRLELIGETLHHALNEIAVAAPQWLKRWVDPVWFDRYERSFNEYRLPLADAEREQLALTIGHDGLSLLHAIYDPSQKPTSLRDLKSVVTLRQVWVQQYALNDDVLWWRDVKNLPPCDLRIQSPYDREARYSNKGTVNWVGYKIHLTETCDQETPHLINHVETTRGTVQDVEVVPKIHADLAIQECLPAQHIADTGYNSAGLFQDSHTQYGIDLISPVRVGRSWQEAANNGFGLSHFQIDWERHRVVCPRGKTSSSWTLCPKRQGHDVFYIKFREPDCRVCPAKADCTRGKRRTISIRTAELYGIMQQKREFQASDEFRALYQQRAGVEGTMSHAAWTLGARRARYRGQEKVHLQNVLTAAAINLTRAVNWLNEIPRAKTRVTRFKALAA